MALRLLSPAIGVMALAGCGGDTPADRLPPAAEPTAPQGESQRWDMVSPADRAKFLAAMTKIDPRLTTDSEHTLDRAVEICYQIFDNESGDAVRTFTQKELTTGAIEVSSEQAEEIVTVVKKWICSDRGLYLHSLT